jgi:hypothetical protein
MHVFGQGRGVLVRGQTKPKHQNLISFVDKGRYGIGTTKKLG